MNKGRKWLCISALVAAGLLSVLCSFFGFLGLGFGGFGRGKDSAAVLGFMLPFLLAFPLFVLSLGVTWLASLGLWCTVPYHWFWLIEVQSPAPLRNPFEFLKLLADCFVQRQMLLLILLAILVQFGIQVIPNFHFDSYLHERMRRNDDSHA